MTRPDPDTCSRQSYPLSAADLETDRLLSLLRQHELDYDPSLILFSTDGLLQFARADLIPFCYCSGERVEDMLRWWYLEGFPEPDVD
jgi:hypothetical protein